MQNLFFIPVTKKINANADNIWLITISHKPCEKKNKTKNHGVLLYNTKVEFHNFK